MKVDRSKLKKSSSEVPADCKVIIDSIKGLNQDDLLRELKEIKTWSFGKCELYHWADVLDIFDSILEKACHKESDKKWTLLCDLPGNEQLKQLLLEVLRFTALLIEHSFSRHLYNSMDHLTTLLTSCDMSAVLYVLNLLYVFSKRSNFISRMGPEKKQGLIQRLVHLAESWGGKENGFGLAECCQDLPKETYPPSATTLHFEFYAENKDDKNKKAQQVSSNMIQSVHMENVDKTGLMPSQIMEEIMSTYDVPEEKQIVLFTHVRLACLFSNYDARVHCVQARLQAISILVYSIAMQDNMNVILYPGLIEELVDIVEIKGPALVDIKSAALRTLTSVIHIERNPRLTSIIDATGASSYHGFLPVLVRTCIQHMIDPALKPFPQTYATSLFSFLYHLASYENGVEALVSCGMMESLLKVINWYGEGQEHITFVTRAVRVIDLITNMDMAAFQGLGGLQAFINRLEHEVNLCREEQPFEILPNHGESGMIELSDVISPMDMSGSSLSNVPLGVDSYGETDEDLEQQQQQQQQSQPDNDSVGPDNSSGGGGAEMVNDDGQTCTGGAPAPIPPPTTPADPTVQPGPSTSGDDGATIGSAEPVVEPDEKRKKHCFAQRAALLKSMLNFMKKAIPDMSFADSIRHLMDGSLPKSLKHIISNAEYYGPSLFLLATDVVTVYVFQEPSLLSSLQDKGLTDVVLHALLVKDVPATREVLASLPNVFSALCLNARGLEAFVACRPFDRLFKVLLSPDYLPAMRRRRSSDPFGDTASNLGNAMDELMRHQPSLRTDATKAIIKLLEEICSMGQDPHFICQKQQPKTDPTSAQTSVRSPQSNEASSSDEEDEEEVEMPHMPPSIAATTHLNVSQTKTNQESMQSNERQPIPLMDYVLNVMKFVEAILSNNSTDDHCREFVLHKGLKPLMSILGLPNLPIDFPSSPACQAVSSVCKSVLTLSREPQVLKQGLLQMNEVLHQLQPLHQPLESPGGSVLLRELANSAHISDSTLSSSATPLLHSLAAAHAYIMMFVHVCRMGQTDIRTISVSHWGSDLGLEVLKGLSSLYNSLVWESTVLLALCNEDYLPPDCQFGRADLDKLLTKDAREKSEAGEGGEGTDENKQPNASEEATIDAPLSSPLSALPPVTAHHQSCGGSDMQMETQQMPHSGEESMDTSETGAVVIQEVTTMTNASSSSTSDVNQPSQGGTTTTQQQQRSEGVQSLNLPFTAVAASTSSASIDSDNILGGSGTAGTNNLSGDKDPKKKVSPAMQAQLRQLKPLLTLSSRLGRALSELFVLLVKLSVGSPVRQRRSQPAPTPTIPSPAARDVALALTKLLAGGLSFKPPAYSPQPKLRMTFLVCSAGFTAPMLFDEKKQPYHLMLQKFVACGGQAALFQSFSWALSMDGRVPLSEGLEHPDLPEGTGEFLDSWLNLVEKMINPKMILESPHTLPPKGKAPGVTPFDPVQYLMTTQKAAFNAVMNLWNKTPLTVHGGRISESVLAILCHIIYGESLLLKQTEKEKAAAASGTGDNAVDLSGAGPSGQLSGPSGAGFSPLTSFLLGGGGGVGHTSSANSASGSGTVTASMAGVGGAGGSGSAGVGGGVGAGTSGWFTSTVDRPAPASFSQQQMSYVNLAHLSQLIDMGFTREQAFVALHNTSSLEQATEYILTHPMPTASEGVGGGGNGIPMYVDDEEGQIMKAIAMSLGENAIMSTDQPKNGNKDKKPGAETEEKQEDEPLDTAVLDEFTQNIFPGCLKLVDTLPETVYRVCDLIVVVMYRNGPQWKKDTLACLCADLSDLCKEMTAYAEANDVTKMLESNNALKFGTRLHLLSLLGEEMNQCVATAMHQASLPSIMTTLLVSSKNALVSMMENTATHTDTSMTTDRNKMTPKWLAPLLLLLDMWEKISITIKRKISARIVVGSNRVWKWFDDSSGRWCKYSTSNNNTIDEAFKRGDSFVRFQAGRRKYSVQFGTMIQLNEETGNRRPVMLSVPTAEDKPPGKKEPAAKETSQTDQIAEEVRKEFEAPENMDNFLPGFTQEVIHVIISALSAYLSIPLTPDCLHATMRLILRLTREHKFAEQFVYENGAQRLLSLTVESNFQGFLNLATLIFRHILEEPVSLRYCMEKVMRNVCAGMGSCRSGVSQGGVGSKEMHYVMRVLGPAACRNPELFSGVAKDTLQISVPSSGKENDDSRYIANAPQFLKCTPTKQLESLVNPWIKNFIWELLNALIVCDKDNSSSQNKSSEKPTDNFVDALNEFMSECQSRQSQSRDASNHAWPTAAAASTTAVNGAAATLSKDSPATTPDESSGCSKQLIPKSAILRLLSEIIRSYGNCVQLITHYTYQAGQSDLVPEACTVLAFVLDNLLSIGQNVGDKDCPVLTRVFIASIASCSLSPDAQMALVTEVKGALQRALALPEGSAKHQRVQALSSIISTMIESCHNPTQLPSHFFKGQHMINNNMMKILVKKNMLVDLARIPHSLDLSSPFLAATVNCILKPMETLSRSVNSPDKFVPMKKGDQATVPDQGGTTTQVVSEPTAAATATEENNENEANQAEDATAGTQMNVTIEDVTNNPEAQNNLEVTTDHHIAEPDTFNQDQGLAEVFSQIFQADRESQALRAQGLSEMTISQVGESSAVDDSEILIDVEVEGDEDDYVNGHHDSQMVSQVLSDEEDDADIGDNDRDPDDNQDDVSGDDEDYDEADQEEMGEDDDDEDEEDEEDEDDEETSDMDGEGDGDGFQEMRNPFDTDDMIFHMEDFPTRSRRRQSFYLNDALPLATIPLPLNMGDDAGNDAMASLPPTPSVITNSHPLLMRTVEGHTSRAHRSGRSRLRPMTTTHVNLSSSTRPTNTPVILQRLLGPSTAAEILQLTSTLSSHTAGAAGPSRVVVAGDNLPFLQRPEDDSFIEEIFQDSDDTSGVLSCIPSTLTRWTEETKVLDGDGVHDLVTTLKPPLVEELIRKRDEELEERKEKRRKAAELSAADNKKKDKPESAATEMAAETSGGESENKAESSVGTSGDAGNNQSSQAAEMLASAIVEQVLSPMVSSSSVTTTTTLTTTASSTTSATPIAPPVFSFLDNSLSSSSSSSSPSPLFSFTNPNAAAPPPQPPLSTSSLLGDGSGNQTTTLASFVPAATAPMPSPDHPMPVFAQAPLPHPHTPSSSDFIPPPPPSLNTWQINNPPPPPTLSSSTTPPPPPPPPFPVSSSSAFHNNQLGADPVWSTRFTANNAGGVTSGATSITASSSPAANSSIITTTTIPSSSPLLSSSSLSSPSSLSSATTAMIQQRQQTTSLISQLLDSIVIPTPSSSSTGVPAAPSSLLSGQQQPSAFVTTTPVMPLSSVVPSSAMSSEQPPAGSSLIHGQNILSTGTPPVPGIMSQSSTLSQNPGSQNSQNNQRNICWSFMQQLGFSVAQQQQQQSAASSSAPINSLAGQQQPQPATAGVTTTNTATGFSPALIQLPMDTSTARANPMSRFESLDPTQDLDFSMIFSPQSYSSGGVTGATPPLSNLTFGPQSVSASSDNNAAAVSATNAAPSMSTSDTLTVTAGSSTTSVTGGVSGGAGGAGGSSSSSFGGESSTDPEIPEGVDPSFLAALPDHIRQEVISEQLRLQRIRRRAEEQAQASVSMTTSNTTAAEANNVMEVNPEFLAALPPAIQEEVLAQQRAEQARLVAQQNATNPDLPVDPATFFSTLPSSLRQQVLSDMDDSMLAVLPPELLTEAQELRRNMEERHRRRLQEPSIIGFLRDCGLANRLGTRFAITAAQRQSQLPFNLRGGTGANNQNKIKGRFMLDPEALTCLLVLLFIDDPKLNTARLHKVFRNLCYHGPTRAWLIRALISIIQKAGDGGGTALISALCVEEKGQGSSKDKGKGKKSVYNNSSSTAQSSSSSSLSSSCVNSSSNVIQQHQPSSEAATTMSAMAAATPMQLEQQHQQSSSSSSLSGSQRPPATSSFSGLWLSISLEAALGCRANVFQIQRAPGKKQSTSSAFVSIHPQAAPVVCRHTLDTLISLAKIFPSHFLPTGKAKEATKCGGDGKKDDGHNEVPKKSSQPPPATSQSQLQQHSSTPTSTNKPPAAESTATTPAACGASSSSSSATPTPSGGSRPDNEFWNILVRLDHASGKSKGKGVQRSHSMNTSDGENAATDYTSSALGQLMGMLSHPVVRRSQLLTDRLLRLLGLISVSLPDNCRPNTTSTSSSSQAPATTTTTTTTSNALMGVGGGGATATTATSASVTTPVSRSTTATTANVGVTADITEESEGGDEVNKASRNVVDEGQPILQDELKLAVEVLTSKSCSEEGLEDATNLLLQLSWANPATRAAVLNLLLSGARQLGLLVCGHIQELLEQLSRLNNQLEAGAGVTTGTGTAEAASSSSEGAGGDESGALGAGASKVAKGVLADRFSGGANVVVSAPTSFKTGRELHLPSMSQLTSKSSGQHFFLRILKVIIQLRDAARTAGLDMTKANLLYRTRTFSQEINFILNRMLNDGPPPPNALLNRMLNDGPPPPNALPVMPAATGLVDGNNATAAVSSTPSVPTDQQQQQQQQDPVSSVSESGVQQEESAMEVDAGPGPSKSDEKAAPSFHLPRLSEQLELDQLWDMLGECLAELARTPDHHAVLILQPAVEAFFIVHAGEKLSKSSEQQSSRREDQLAHLNLEMAPPSPATAGSGSSDGATSAVSRDSSGASVATVSHLPADTQKFLKFAETHRTVLNQILRQSTLPLSDGPFSVLVDHMRILDFDVKRRYFRQELERLNEGARREDLPVHVRRSNVFEDSFRELFRRSPEEWKQRFYIVFEGEEGQDAGGLLREWYIIISHEIFNQNYALFRTSPGDRVTYTISPSSHCNSNHLSYFKFVGRIIAKAVYDNKLLDCYFTRSFYKHMLGLAVKYTDMESEDYAFYQGLHFLLENKVVHLGYDLLFSTEVQEFGVTETRELMPDGSNILVTEDNKREYVKRVCQMKMTGAIRQQLNAFLEGFYDIIPKKLVSIFTEQELELLISGLPTIDIDDLKANTEYIKYQATSLQIQWFWRALRSFDQAERANFLQFVTGTSKVPLGGFANLEGMNGTQKFQIHRDDRSTDRLPSAHTCFNQLDLPAYETYDKLRKMLLLAVNECSEGFGLA